MWGGGEISIVFVCVYTAIRSTQFHHFLLWVFIFTWKGRRASALHPSQSLWRMRVLKLWVKPASEDGFPITTTSPASYSFPQCSFILYHLLDSNAFDWHLGILFLFIFTHLCFFSCISITYWLFVFSTIFPFVWPAALVSFFALNSPTLSSVHFISTQGNITPSRQETDPFAEAHRRAVPNIMTMSCVPVSSPEKWAVTD